MLRKLCVFLCLGCVLLLFSCSSTKKDVEQDPDFLGDYEPIQLENAMGWVTLFGKEKPKEIELYFVPRTNRAWNAKETL